MRLQENKNQEPVINTIVKGDSNKKGGKQFLTYSFTFSCINCIILPIYNMVA